MARKYETKYDNDTYHFIKSLNPNGQFQQTALSLGVTYIALFVCFRNNRISYPMKKRIEKTFNLTNVQQSILNQLTLK